MGSYTPGSFPDLAQGGMDPEIQWMVFKDPHRQPHMYLSALLVYPDLCTFYTQPTMWKCSISTLKKLHDPISTQPYSKFGSKPNKANFFLK